MPLFKLWNEKSYLFFELSGAIDQVIGWLLSQSDVWYGDSRLYESSIVRSLALVWHCLGFFTLIVPTVHIYYYFNIILICFFSSNLLLPCARYPMRDKTTSCTRSMFFVITKDCFKPT